MKKSVFFGAYFATSETKEIATKEGTIFNETNKMAGIFPFKGSAQTMVIFRSPKLNYDYKNLTQQKQILKENLIDCHWKIPQIVEIMLKNDNLYFDEICQIKMPS